MFWSGLGVGVQWEWIERLMEVSTMLYKCTYCGFTLCDRFIVLYIGFLKKPCAKKTPGLFFGYKEDGLLSRRPPKGIMR